MNKMYEYFIRQTDDMKTKQTNGYGSADKTAKIFATDFAHETFIAFKGDKAIDCDNCTRNNIKRMKYFLSKLVLGLFTCKQIASDIYYLCWLSRSATSIDNFAEDGQFFIVLSLFCREERGPRNCAGKMCVFVVETTILWCYSWRETRFAYKFLYCFCCGELWSNIYFNQ